LLNCKKDILNRNVSWS